MLVASLGVCVFGAIILAGEDSAKGERWEIY